MRLHLHGMDPSKCKPGDSGKWEMLEEAAEGKPPGAATPGSSAPVVPHGITPPPPGKKKSPAMEYLKGKK